MTISASAPASSSYQLYNPVSSPVAVKTQGANLASDAAQLSAEAGIIGTASGSISGLDAVSLLNTLTQAGSVQSPITVPTAGTGSAVSGQVIAQDANDASVVNTLGGSSSAAGIYSASGSLQNLSSAVNANLSTLLNTNPALAANYVGASFSSGILSTINTSA
jgi:hypothetical protein